MDVCTGREMGGTLYKLHIVMKSTQVLLSTGYFQWQWDAQRCKRAIHHKNVVDNT